MTDKFLSMNLPEGFKKALNRRFNGSPHTNEEIAKAYYLITKMYQKYMKYEKKEDHLLNVEWKEENIEAHFQSNLWYNAHRRLNRYRSIIKETHKSMFQLLVSFDGNPSQEFSQFECISAEEIFEDFKGKYIE